MYKFTIFCLSYYIVLHICGVCAFQNGNTEGKSLKNLEVSKNMSAAEVFPPKRTAVVYGVTLQKL